MVKLRELRPYMKKLLPVRYMEIENMIRKSERKTEKTATAFLIRVKHTLYTANLNRQCRRR